MVSVSAKKVFKIISCLCTFKDGSQLSATIHHPGTATIGTVVNRRRFKANSELDPNFPFNAVPLAVL
jgi:hypothetical protein